MLEDTRHPYIKYTASKGKEEDDFGEVLLPFSSFTAKQDEMMQDMKAMSIWGNRGVEGAVDLEIRSIQAYGCDTTAGQQ